jgi:hypothetical protein
VECKAYFILQKLFDANKIKLSNNFRKTVSLPLLLISYTYINKFFSFFMIRLKCVIDFRSPKFEFFLSRFENESYGPNPRDPNYNGLVNVMKWLLYVALAFGAMNLFFL